MFQIIKDNLFYLLAVIVLLVLGVNTIAPKFTSTYNVFTEANSVRSELNNVQAQVADLRIQKATKEKTPKGDAKRIFELEGAQFGAEASFAPLFEIVLNIAQSSGIRIRSIDYNYQPDADPIYAAHMPEYNVCELQILAVGSYAQFQNFFKGIMKDQNLAYLAEVELMPWEKDKSILISNVKVRLYTKTPGAPSSIPATADAGVPPMP